MSFSVSPRSIGAALMLVGGLGLIGWAFFANGVPAPAPGIGEGQGDASEMRIYAPSPPGSLPLSSHNPAEDCSGCHPSKHPTPELPDAAFRDLLVSYQAASVAESSEALDALLFYGPQTRIKLAQFGRQPMDDDHEAFLSRELNRPGILIELRVIDSHGVQRVTMPPTFWPFDQKQHYYPTADELVDMHVPDINGTAKRVGLHHIWVRC